MGKGNRLINLFHKVIDFLEKHQIEYVLIGGLAVDVWGLPRKTNDIDAVILSTPDHYDEFLRQAKRAGFQGESQKLQMQLNKMGMCRLNYQRLHADFIMGYSNFEKEVFLRKRKVSLFGRKVWVASPDDIILYKILAAREIDKADIKNIIIAQGKNLDKAYLRSRVKLMQHELNRFDMVKTLEKYL
ncbi:MAG: nucleotidyltransferase [Planctomycetota bacterium]